MMLIFCTWRRQLSQLPCRACGGEAQPSRQPMLNSNHMDREQELKRVQAILASNGLDDSRIAQLLQEAEDSGDYTEMTAQDWEDIEREGLALLRARKSA
jgi:hypothetical protein